MLETHIRGAIRYIDRYKQLISYEGLERMRHITPTDIDGLIDYGGTCFLYLECKQVGKKVEYGQKLALENLIKSHEKAGHKACCLLFTHDNYPDEIIDAKSKIVIAVYRKRKDGFWWMDISDKCITVLEAVQCWETYCKLS